MSSSLVTSTSLPHISLSLSFVVFSLFPPLFLSFPQVGRLGPPPREPLARADCGGGGLRPPKTPRGNPLLEPGFGVLPPARLLLLLLLQTHLFRAAAALRADPLLVRGVPVPSRLRARTGRGAGRLRPGQWCSRSCFVGGGRVANGGVACGDSTARGCGGRRGGELPGAPVQETGVQAGGIRPAVGPVPGRGGPPPARVRPAWRARPHDEELFRVGRRR